MSDCPGLLERRNIYVPGLYLSLPIAVCYDCIKNFLIFVHGVDDRDFAQLFIVDGILCENSHHH